MTRIDEYIVSPAEILRIGPYILVEIAGELGPALLDTGASFSVIDITTAQDLQLEEDKEPHHVVGATGGGMYPRFLTDLYIPVLGFTIDSPMPSLPLMENDHPWVAIIGRDVICQYEFTVNGQTGLIRFASA